jgi:hypothetical protein
MFRFPLSVAALVIFSPHAFATSVVNVQSTVCSGTESANVTGPIVISCVGDLSLYGGTLADTSSIFLSATGTLTLDSLTISAPQIQFSSGSSLTLGSGVTLVGTSVSLVGNASGTIPAVSIATGAIILGPGSSDPGPLVVSGGGFLAGPVGTVTITPADPISLAPVPLPAAYSNMLVGLMAMLGLQFVYRRNT